MAADEAETETDRIDRICEQVAAGKTLRQIAREFDVTSATVLRWVTADEESTKHYARARELAADLFENDIYDAAMSASPETAASDRVKIDALKWIAARRAPKRYGDRVDHVSTDGSLSPRPTVIELVSPEK
ncbi:hypothetical protein D3C85_726390 [compost metagenome]